MCQGQCWGHRQTEAFLDSQGDTQVLQNLKGHWTHPEQWPEWLLEEEGLRTDG